MQHGKTDAVNKGIHAIMAITIVVFAFSLFYALLFKSVTGTEKDVVLFVLGVVSTNLTNVVGYYFGSSKGSDDKTIILDNAVKSGMVNGNGNGTDTQLIKG